MARTKHTARRLRASSSPSISQTAESRPVLIPPAVKTVVKPKQPSRSLKEIERYQGAKKNMTSSDSYKLLIPKAPFARVVRELAQKYKSDMRFERLALEVLQEATEDFLVGLLRDAYYATIHAKRVELQVKDIQLVLKLRRGGGCGL